MRVKEARMSGTWLMLDIEHDDLPDARRFVYGFKTGNYVIKKVAVKRSLNANALCWKLCSAIGAAVGDSAVNVYRRAIKEGSVCTYVVLPAEAVQRFVQDWTSRGEGWVVQVVNDYGDKTELLAYYGSSTYTSKEMSVLIDRLLQDADSLGLDVLSEQERSLLEDLDVR